mgnify:CR=1 FL=1
MKLITARILRSKTILYRRPIYWLKAPIINHKIQVNIKNLFTQSQI